MHFSLVTIVEVFNYGAAMVFHQSLEKNELKRLVKRRLIQFAGNRKLKIYGRLDCYSGKRMKKENRVFFENEQQAIALGFRPCKNCMK